MDLRTALLLIPFAMLPLLCPAEEQAKPFKLHEIAVGKEMLITDLAVVNAPEANYPGVWSFGHLVDEAFGPAKSREIVAGWLEGWANGSGPGCSGENRIAGRENLYSLVIAPWKQRDGYQGGAAPWLPNLTNAPFRLLAIVNRLDLGRPVNPPSTSSTSLGSTGGYSGGDSLAKAPSGEARLIFGTVDSKGEPLAGGMTLIFEYGLDGNAVNWARGWHALGEHQDFDNAYCADLAAFTRSFTDRRLETTSLPVTPGAPSGTCQLLRIRTNDGACGKLREFRQFDVAPPALTAVRLPGTPDEPFFKKGSKENRLLSAWLDQQRIASKEVAEKFARENKPVPDSMRTEIPASLPSLPSLSLRGKSNPVSVSGFVSTVENNDKQFHWEGWGLRDERLHRLLSAQTCCGCHCGDTGTEFFHVAPRSYGEPAAVSKFLRTDGSKLRLKDPASRHSFETAEMEDRKRLYLDLLSPGLSNSEIKKLAGERAGRIH